MATTRVRVQVSGRVQGVGFRYSTYHEAVRLNLGGWVCNRFDGRVEAVFEGEEAAVRDMVDWCREGPPGARVAGIDVAWETPNGEFRDFRIRS